MGILYIVATPIGNLKDITLRALEVLKSVDLILAEDTRVSQKILGYYDIKCKTLSYHQHSSDEKKYEILNSLIDGKNLALITDAGTPGISDPGNELVDFLLDKLPELKITPIPGPSAITTALSVCGFNVGNFLFLGFWPKKRKAKILKVISESKVPVVFFESPYRVIKTLDLLSEHLGNTRRIFVAREMTKMYETFYRGTIQEVKEKLLKDKLKGEIVVVVEGG